MLMSMHEHMDDVTLLHGKEPGQYVADDRSISCDGWPTHPKLSDRIAVSGAAEVAHSLGEPKERLLSSQTHSRPAKSGT